MQPKYSDVSYSISRAYKAKGVPDKLYLSYEIWRFMELKNVATVQQIRAKFPAISNYTLQRVLKTMVQNNLLMRASRGNYKRNKLDENKAKEILIGYLFAKHPIRKKYVELYYAIVENGVIFRSTLFRKMGLSADKLYVALSVLERAGLIMSGKVTEVYYYTKNTDDKDMQLIKKGANTSLRFLVCKSIYTNPGTTINLIHESTGVAKKVIRSTISVLRKKQLVSIQYVPTKQKGRPHLLVFPYGVKPKQRGGETENISISQNNSYSCLRKKDGMAVSLPAVEEGSYIWLSKNLKHAFSESTILKRKNPKRLFSITLNSLSHKNLLVPDFYKVLSIRKNKIKLKKAEDLRTGDYVAVTKNLSRLRVSTKTIRLQDFGTGLENLRVVSSKLPLFIDKTVQRIVPSKLDSHGALNAYLGSAGAIYLAKKRLAIRASSFKKLCDLSMLDVDNEFTLLGRTLSDFNRNINIKIPSQVNTDVAYLLGLHSAEGGKTNEEQQVSISNTDPHILKKWKDTLLKSFPELRTYTRNRTTGTNSCVLKSLWTNAFNISVGRRASYSVSVPLPVISAGKDCLYSYLSGAIDGDGTAGKDKLSITTCSIQNVDDLLFIFNRLDMCPTSCAVSSSENTLYYTLTAYGRNDLRRLYSKLELVRVGFSGKLARILTTSTHEKSLIDIIPASLVAKSLGVLFRKNKLSRKKVSSAIYAQNNIKISAPSIYDYIKGRNNITKAKYIALIKVIRRLVPSTIENKRLVDKLSLIAESEVRWLKIRNLGVLASGKKQKYPIIKPKSKDIKYLLLDFIYVRPNDSQSVA